MKLIGSFFRFARRVLDAAKAGGLPESDLGKLDRLLQRTGKKNLILAKGILTALSSGGAGEADIHRFGLLLEQASQRINEEKIPFTTSDEKELEDIFHQAYLSKKATKWFAANVDELLADEIDETIYNKKKLPLPTKKTVKIDEDKEGSGKKRLKA